jgi:hypothetical protein
MIKFISHEAPADLYKMKIDDLSLRMRNLVVRAHTGPLRSMTLFGILEKNFARVEKEAQHFCAHIGHTRSRKTEEQVLISTLYSIKRLSRIRDRAHELVEEEDVVALEPERSVLALGLIGSLYALSEHDQTLIDHDPTLREDMAQLFTSVLFQDMSKPQEWKKLIEHMISEVKTSFADDARMSDEGPCCIAEGCAAHGHMDEYPGLQRTLEGLHAKHFMECD